MRIITEFEGSSLLFERPHRIITCDSPQQLPLCLASAEQALQKGYFLAGFLSYEAGYALEPCLTSLCHGDFPLLSLGVFSAPSWLPAVSKSALFDVTGLRPDISKEQYFRDIGLIRGHILDGDVYQVTFCLKYLFDVRGSHYALYRSLLRRQPVPYAAYLETAFGTVLSLSPELFVCKKGSHLRTRPMKGSWPREGLISALLGGIRLHFDAKNRAENLMITDLLRNDLGRIGRGVNVPRLFEVSGYRTIFQMTSTVDAQVPQNIPLSELLRALFPSGSVTGAPNVEAMKIIRRIEPGPRKVYTGAIGWISPQRDMMFNVPIRTLLVKDGHGEMGVGGGIVWDSTPEGEWAESQWKSRFLREVST